MSTFRSIEELVKSLDREKELLKEMFAKRKSLSFRYDYALEMTEYKEERIRYLIDYGVIRDTGDFLEMEDIYLKFFEDVLEVNEEINVSFVQDYLTRLNENIDYYLKENNEQRKYNYQREVKRCLKNIALLIRKSEELIDYGQPTFFRVAMDVQMRNVVSDVKLQLNDSYHNLIEIQKQIIHYLNLIDYQNRILEKVKKLKYLKDQFLLEEHTDIRQVVAQKNPVWMEPQVGYRIKLSIDNLRTSDEAFQLMKKLAARQKNSSRGMKQLADAIPEEYLDGQSQTIDSVNLQEVHNAFMASSAHLFYFVMNYRFRKEVTRGEKLIFFCQLASQYADELHFTDTYETSGEVEYPLIYSR